MPKQVDRELRRREITQAAMQLLADEGPAALTVRALAQKLGGSITLVTHFYPTRADLLQAITRQVMSEFDTQLKRREAGRSAQDRLRLLLEWMLPLRSTDRRSETGRLMLVGERSSDPSVQYFFVAMDAKMRELLRSHLDGLVADDEVEPLVELLRVFTNGIVLSAVEHPTQWSQRRQLDALHGMMARIGLSDPAVEVARHG